MPKMLKMGNGTHSLTPWGGDKYHWNRYGEADLRNLVNLLGHFFLLDGSSIYMWPQSGNPHMTHRGLLAMGVTGKRR